MIWFFLLIKKLRKKIYKPNMTGRYVYTKAEEPEGATCFGLFEPEPIEEEKTVAWAALCDSYSKYATPVAAPRR